MTAHRKTTAEQRPESWRERQNRTDEHEEPKREPGRRQREGNQSDPPQKAPQHGAAKWTIIR